MDQFTYAERATDWRGNNNIAESVFAQMVHERHPVPAWIVVGAGTGGTSADLRAVSCAIGRHATSIAVVDPENSGILGLSCDRRPQSRLRRSAAGSRASAGRASSASFIRDVVDRMIEVPDLDSVAAMRVLSQMLGRKIGPSTGTNFIGVLALRREMLARGETGSIVSLICDSGERYQELFGDECVARRFGAGLATEAQRQLPRRLSRRPDLHQLDPVAEGIADINAVIAFQGLVRRCRKTRLIQALDETRQIADEEAWMGFPGGRKSPLQHQGAF